MSTVNPCQQHKSDSIWEKLHFGPRPHAMTNHIWPQNCKPIISHFLNGPRILTLGIETQVTVIWAGPKRSKISLVPGLITTWPPRDTLWEPIRTHQKNWSDFVNCEPIRSREKKMIQLSNEVHILIRLCQSPVTDNIILDITQSGVSYLLFGPKVFPESFL